MKQCFGYVRVSSIKQGEGVSLEAQKDAILRFADANSVAISEWFEEQQTAAKSGRPVFNQMLRALKAGKATGVVMHKIDRSARNFFDWAKIGELADSGVDVHFATESLDFQSRGGRLTANIQMAVAEDYVRNLRTEIFKGQRGQLERGYYPFSAPIGYLNSGKRQLKTIDPVKGPLVKLAFELYGSGQYSYEALRLELADHGFTQPSGKPISRGCIEAFLANPFYTGVIRIKRTGETFNGAHEPLISSELYKRVQTLRASRKSKKFTRHNHLFRGLFDCGQCGRSMIPELQKGHVYYRCHVANCAINCVREEQMDRAVADVLSNVRISDEHLETIESRVREWGQTIGDTSAEQKTIAMQLANFDSRLKQLEDAAIEQIIDKDNFHTRKEELLLERSQVEEKAEKQVAFHQRPVVIRRFLELIKNLIIHYYSASPADKREIVEIALSNRNVTAKNVSTEPSDWLQRAEDAIGILTCADACAHSRTFTGTDDDAATVRPSRQCTLGADTCATYRTFGDTADDATTAPLSRQCTLGADARPTSRTSDHEKAESLAINNLVELARSPEVERLFGLFMDEYTKTAFGKGGKQSDQAAV